jgi:hypothetical protein
VIFLAFIIASPATADGWDLVRVDQPDFPGAEAVSAAGSVLLEPPTDGTAWRTESVPELAGASSGGLALEEVWDPRATEAIGLDAWHAAGHLGQGVRVAIFDVQWFGAAFREIELGSTLSHDCWADVQCESPIDSLRPRFDFERGSHGVACAEVIRDLAPEAELHLVRVNGLTTLENAVDWAIREEMDIISMSMTFFNESFYDGTGPVSELVDRLEAANILMVTSAGNNGERHYEDVFRDQNRNGFHEFRSGSEYLPIRAKGGDGRVAAVVWDEFQDCGRSDLRVELVDASGNTIRVANHFQDFENEKCTPVERIRAPIELDGDWVYLRIERVLGEGALPFDIMSFSGGIFGAISENSMADPAPHPLSFTVGAVHVENYMHSPVEAFSSQGPSRGPVLKPSLVAPDGLSTRTYGANRFFGTSASAPVTASALAVRMSADGSLSPRQAAMDLQAWAWSGSNTWTQPDLAMGAGRLRLPDPSLEGNGGCTSRPLHATLLLLPLFAFRRKRIDPHP